MMMGCGTEDMEEAMSLDRDLCSDVLTLIREQEPRTVPLDPGSLCAYQYHVKGKGECKPVCKVKSSGVVKNAVHLVKLVRIQ